MKKIALMWLAVAVSAGVSAQNYTPKNIQADAFMHRVAGANPRNLIDVGQQIPVFPIGAGTKVNEVYVDPAWKTSSLTLYSSEKVVEGYKVRYDLRANSLEFKMADQIKVLDAGKIKTLICLDSATNLTHFFVNGKDFKVDGTPPNTLLEFMSEGKLNLYKQYTYWIKKADYNPALNVGSVDEKIYLKPKFLYGSGVDLKEVTTKKKDFPLIFGEQAGEMTTYMKEHNLSPAKEFDLLRIFEYYNSLK